MMKYKLCILLMFAFLIGCKSTKQTIKTDTKANETVLADVSVEAEIKEAETIVTIINEKTDTDETITEIFYSRPDSTGTAHVIKTVETIRTIRKEINAETDTNINKEEIKKEVDKTISDTNIKTESRFSEKEKFPVWVLVFMAMAVVAVLIIIGKFIKEIW